MNWAHLGRRAGACGFRLKPGSKVSYTPGMRLVFPMLALGLFACRAREETRSEKVRVTVELDIHVFRLQHLQPAPRTPEGGDRTEPAFLGRVLRTVLTKDASGRLLGAFEYDPQVNAFIIKDTKVVLARIAEIIPLLDVPPPLVSLDVKFFYSTNKDLLTSLPAGKSFLTHSELRKILNTVKQDKLSRSLRQAPRTLLDKAEAMTFVGEPLAADSPVMAGFQFFVLPRMDPQSDKIDVAVLYDAKFTTEDEGHDRVIEKRRKLLLKGVNSEGRAVTQLTPDKPAARLTIESGMTAVVYGYFKHPDTAARRPKKALDADRNEYLLTFITPRLIPMDNEGSVNYTRLIELREEMEQRDFERWRQSNKRVKRREY